MKYFFLLMILPVVGYSQFKTNDAGNLEYELVVQADSLSAQQLHDKAAEWTALTYNSSQTVTNLDRDDKIIINARIGLNLSFNDSPDTDLLYSLVIAFKDGRYKIDFTNLITETKQAGSSTSTPVKEYVKISFEDFKQMMYDQLEHVQVDASTKKIVKGQYEEPGFLEQVYEGSKAIMEDTEISIKLEILRISKSLQDYVKGSYPDDSEDDW